MTHSTDLSLSIDALHCSYPTRRGVLRDITLTLQAGERVGVIGPNGTGKTTLFLSICGVLKPDQGNIVVAGAPVVPGNFRPDIGLVFQNPDDQLFCPSVRDDVAFGPLNMGLSQPEVDARVTEALTITGIRHLAERTPHRLSGGEKRMVAIAGVLAMRPRLVIYDEPFANLDLEARRRLIHFLQTAQETILLASHDLEAVLEVCSRVVLMDGGHIVADGIPHEIMADAALMQAHRMEPPASLMARVEHVSG